MAIYTCSTYRQLEYTYSTYHNILAQQVFNGYIYIYIPVQHVINGNIYLFNMFTVLHTFNMYAYGKEATEGENVLRQVDLLTGILRIAQSHTSCVSKYINN